jgi:hypothetical protein
MEHYIAAITGLSISSRLPIILCIIIGSVCAVALACYGLERAERRWPRAIDNAVIGTLGILAGLCIGALGASGYAIFVAGLSGEFWRSCFGLSLCGGSILASLSVFAYVGNTL